MPAQRLNSLLISWLRRHFGVGFLDDFERLVGRRHAGVDGHVQQRFANVFRRRAGIGGGPRMHRDFLVMAERGEQRQRDDRAFALGQIGPRPYRTPGAFGDERLERLVERGHRRAGAVDMRVAQHRSARRHSRLVARVFVVAHGKASFLCASIRPRTTSGFSTQGMWPTPAMVSNFAAGMRWATVRGTRSSGGVDPSSSPTIHRVGARISFGGLRQIRVAQRATGGEIAVLRRARQHGAPAGEFVAAIGAKILREPALHHAIGDRFDAVRLDGADARAPALRRADSMGGVAENERGDEVRAQAIEFLRDHAADRQADDGCRARAEMIEQRGEIGGEIGHGRAGCGQFGVAVAAFVVAEDARILSERFGDLVPDAQICAERIDEDDRLGGARSLVGIMDDAAIRPDKRHRFPSLRRRPGRS